jgi:hypothetical protein
VSAVAANLRSDLALIADLAEGRVELDAAARAHLAACQQCADDLSWVTQTLALLRARELEEPPPPAVELTRALFRRRPARPASRPILAALGFDSSIATPAFGLRASATAERQLIFHAASYSIDLRVRPVEGRWVVAGQLLGGDDPGAMPPGARAEILGPADAASAEMDALSEFELPPIRPGHYSLTLLLGELILVIPALELGT